MKNITAFLLCFSLLLSCNNNETVNTAHESESKDQAHEAVPDSNGLILNNGQKWKSDASTDRNVAVLRNTVQKFETKQDPSLEDYRYFAKDLRAGIDTMVKECKMKGADHDALHQWLEPLMKNVRDLEKKADTKDAAVMAKEISNRVEMYSQYFAAS